MFIYLFLFYFSLIFYVKESIPEVDDIIKRTFPESSITEVFGGTGRKYDIGQIKSLSFAFQQLETNKEKLKISEYSITQTTLEQVFLHFAKHQELPPENFVWDRQ